MCVVGDGRPRASPRPLVVDPDYAIWQGRYSPDGRWVLFNAQSLKQAGVSILGVVPASGGKWIPLTDPTLWADKARWAPDGKAIYFISNRDSAFFDVWGIEFDPAKGADGRQGIPRDAVRQPRPDHLWQRRLGAGRGPDAHRAADRRVVGKHLGTGRDQAVRLDPFAQATDRGSQPEPRYDLQTAAI